MLLLASEYSRFSLLLAAKDVSPARWNVCDSATEIPYDDVKSVRNLVRNSDWST